MSYIVIGMDIEGTVRYKYYASLEEAEQNINLYQGDFCIVKGELVRDVQS